MTSSNPSGTRRPFNLPIDARIALIMIGSVCLATGFSGCDTGTGPPTQAEQLALANIRKAGGRLYSKQGRVRKIDFSKAKLAEDDFKNIKECERLKELILHGATFQEAWISQLNDMDWIARLSLKETGITDEGLVHLKGWARLEELDLEGTAVTDAGLQHLIELKRLKKLYLDGTQTTRAGADSLSRAIPHIKIYGP